MDIFLLQDLYEYLRFIVWIDILILPMLSFRGCHVWAVH